MWILETIGVAAAMFLYVWMLFSFQEIEDEDNLKKLKKILEEHNPKV